MKIKIVKELDKINNIIKKFDNVFVPSISSIIGNLDEYAEKLFKNAMVISLLYDNEIIGFAAFYCNDNINKIAFLSQIGVLNNYKSKGYGTFLIKKAEELSKSNNMEKMRLEVYDNNLNGICFYKKNGYIFEKKCSENSNYMIKELR